MTWVLILYVSYGSYLSVTTAEFSSEQRCHEAIAVAQAKLDSSYLSRVKGLCVPK